MPTKPLLAKLFFLSLTAFLLGPLPEVRADLTHEVKQGESLSVIARKYSLTVSDLQEANELEGTRIQIGQILIIPSEERDPSPKPKRESALRADRGAPDTHVVKKGETLSHISRRYSLTVKGLQELNSLAGSLLKAGQVLLLRPEKPEESPGPSLQGRGGPRPALQEESPAQDCPGEKNDCQALVEIARSFLGAKYRRGGNSLTSGVDCSAFVQKVFQKVGVDLPRTAREQFETGLEVARDALRLGDLVFFRQNKGRRPGHVGIYIGDDEFIHSSTTKRRVRIDSLNTRYFSIRFLGGRRIPEIEKESLAPGPEAEDFQVFHPPPSLALYSQASSPRTSFHPDLQFLAGR